MFLPSGQKLWGRNILYPGDRNTFLPYCLADTLKMLEKIIFNIDIPASQSHVTD